MLFSLIYPVDSSEIILKSRSKIKTRGVEQLLSECVHFETFNEIQNPLRRNFQTDGIYL